MRRWAARKTAPDNSPSGSGQDDSVAGACGMRELGCSLRPASLHQPFPAEQFLPDLTLTQNHSRCIMVSECGFVKIPGIACYRVSPTLE